MTPRMSAAELVLFTAFVSMSRKYLEFGTGGSTFVASSYPKDWLISIDSSTAWLGKVAKACQPNPSKPELIFTDIGPTKSWGYPADPATIDKWPSYHSDIWSDPRSPDADLYFIDGRFRVACFAQAVLHARPGTLIGFHDFTSRRRYHVVRQIAREIAVAEDISFFITEPGADATARQILEKFRLTPE